MSNEQQTKQQQGLEQAGSPQLCNNNCGFFANPTCSGLCSKCYKDKDQQASQKKQVEKQVEKFFTQNNLKPDLQEVQPIEKLVQQQIEVGQQIDTVTQEKQNNILSQDAEKQANQDAAPQVSKPSRCAVCKKKVGLTGFSCKCGHIYCASHRLAEAHACNFDYKSSERGRIEQNNPLIIAQKLDKI